MAKNIPHTHDGMQDNPLSKLVDEARALYETVLKEIAANQWAGYEKHLSSYHELIVKAYRAGVTDELVPIRPLGQHLLGSAENPSDMVKVELLEIMKRAWILCGSLKNTLDKRLPFNLTPESVQAALSRVEAICDRFHLMAIQLRGGYQGKQGVSITNEYDIQHLLRAALALDFDDVSPEEWSPPYAGGPARMDFLIMPYGIVVETKMTRKGLADKRIGEELLVDIARYRKHPDSRFLLCFIYDPEGRINNPTRLANELQNSSTDDFSIKVIIRPFGR